MLLLVMIVIYCKLSFVITAGQADFDKLRLELEQLYSTNPRLIPLVVRLAFHDLFHQKTVGGRGCIQKQAFLDLTGNAGLAHPINVLKQVLRKPEINDSDFKFGDVIAFASKVAVETAYPCIRIKFKFNRQDCEEEEPINDVSNSIPGSFLVDLKELQLTLDYLGLDLMDFGVIMAGAHGIQGAQSHNEISGVFGTFSRFSSGKDYILQTLNNDWTVEEHNLGSVFFTGPYLTRLIRLPLDILLFSNQTRNMGDAEWSKQELLRRAESLPRSLFDKTFAAAFEKLLMTGGGTQDLQDPEQILQTVDHCIDPEKV
jgi:hypothetical protein